MRRSGLKGFADSMLFAAGNVMMAIGMLCAGRHLANRRAAT